MFGADRTVGQRVAERWCGVGRLRAALRALALGRRAAPTSGVLIGRPRRPGRLAQRMQAGGDPGLDRVEPSPGPAGLRRQISGLLAPRRSDVSRANTPTASLIAVAVMPTIMTRGCHGLSTSGERRWAKPEIPRREACNRPGDAAPLPAVTGFLGRIEPMPRPSNDSPARSRCQLGFGRRTGYDRRCSRSGAGTAWATGRPFRVAAPSDRRPTSRSIR